MPKVQGSLPVTWTDALGPSFSLGAGGAAPAPATFVGNVRVMQYDAGENSDFSIQLPHDIYIPSSGNITLKPHVHFTFISEPTTAQTVIWEVEYLYAKGGASLATAGAFQAATTVLTPAAYTTVAAAEIRAHLIQAVGDIVIPVASVAPSMIIQGRLSLKATSTIAVGVCGLLSFDIHYQIGPTGTDTEFA